MPVPPEITVLNHRIIGKLSQFLFLNSVVSKMAGFMLGSGISSSILHHLRLSRFINAQVDQTYSEFGYASMNEAFTHRYGHTIYPRDVSAAEADAFITAPVSAYLSIRDIEAGVLDLFPGVRISVARMLGMEDSSFLSGKLLVFTLKPHHDHTIDFPTESSILSGPVEISKNRFRVDSTDLSYIRSNSRRGVMDQNHRAATILHSRPFDEKYAMVEVGANIVNSIEQDYDGTNRVHKRGTQKAHFNFGSTVILAIPEAFMAKVKIVEDIHSHSSRFDGACEVKRGTVIMYDRSVKTGTYSVSDGVSLRITNEGGGITEAIERSGQP